MALGVAVVGLGVGEQHARAFARAGCSVRWLVDLDGARAASVAAALGQGRPSTSYEEALRDPEVAIVSIASFDDAHADQAMAALRAGKHVFVEKPLCTRWDDLQRIAHEWRAAASLQLACNLVLRAAPLWLWLRDRVKGRGLGRIYAIDSEYLYGRLEKLTGGWRGRVPGYSVMLGGGVHLIDLMLWTLGERPLEVAAAGNGISTEGSVHQGPDFVAATLRFPSGVVGRVVANLGCVHRHHHVLRVFGTAATFFYDDAGPRLHWTRDPALRAAPVDLPALPATKGDLIPAFVAAVEGGASVERDTEAALEVVAVCLAADEAVRTGTWVQVRYA